MFWIAGAFTFTLLAFAVYALTDKGDDAGMSDIQYWIRREEKRGYFPPFGR